MDAVPFGSGMKGRTMERAYVSTALVRRDKIGRVGTEITPKRPPQRHDPDDLSVATPKRKRTYNIRRIKATWPYSVQEIAELFGIHKNAVLRWLQDGLQANRDQRPFLIRGAELARFLTARQISKRRKCSTTEFYCFKCRDAREAYLRIADVAIESPTRLRVKALCAVCSTPINKVQSIRDLEKIQIHFHVQQLKGEHILERTPPSLNCDLET
jgi:hypothetical protein